MIWPFRRRPSTADALLAVAASLDRLAEAHVEAAKIRARWTVPEDPVAPETPLPPAEAAFRAWYDAQEFGDDIEAGDVWGSWEIVSGKREAGPERRQRAREILRERRAPLPG